MYCGTTAYTWKTAYDAAYAKFSPGTLLIDRVTDQLLAGPDILAINSCADEASFMTHLWTGRRRMVDLLVDVGRARSPQYHLEAMRQLGYERLRDLRDQIRRQMTALRAKKLEPAAGGA